jgi:outer membrane lipoprotein-sorting protein
VLLPVALWIVALVTAAGGAVAAAAAVLPADAAARPNALAPGDTTAPRAAAAATDAAPGNAAPLAAAAAPTDAAAAANPAAPRKAAAPIEVRDPQAILAASDAIRNPDRSFGLTTTLTEYHNGRETDSSTLEIYAKAERNSGQYRNLIRFVAPVRDANKLMLKNGNDLWFYDPSSQASVRLSPRQRLLGQAANGDVVTVNLAKDYRAEAAGVEDVQDGERVLRHCHRLALTAVSGDATYDRIEIWIDADSSRPAKAKFFAASGQLLKTAYYRRYQRELDVERPTETVIIDGLDPQWVTIMRYSGYAWRDVPDSWLQRDYLARFRPE